MVFGLPTSLIGVPLEHREVDHPGEGQQLWGGQLEASTDLASYPIEAGRDDRRLVGHQDQQVARPSAQAFYDRGKLLRTQIPGEGGAKLSLLNDGNEHRGPRASASGDLLQLIQLLARVCGAAGCTHTFDLSLDAQNVDEDIEARISHQIADLNQLQAIPQVRFVRSKARHGFRIGQPGEGGGQPLMWSYRWHHGDE